MKIAYVVESASAGVGKHVIDSTIGLTRRGHTMHLIYSPTRIDTRFRDGVSSAAELGGTAYEIPIRHGPHPSDIPVVFKIRQSLRQHGPFDILHCHSTKAGLVGRLSGLRLGTKIVYTPHAFLTMSQAAPIARRAGARVLERLLSKTTNGIICVSHEELQHAKSIGIHPKRLFHVPNGIDDAGVKKAAANRQSIREGLKLADSDIAIGFVGRLFPQKAPHALVQAFATALQSLPTNAKLVIVGDGPLRPLIESQIQRLKIGANVVMAGEMPGEKSMAAFDIFALPSQYEAFPYVIIEAIASGLPIIATDVGGVSSLVQPNENGFVSPVGDTDAMARSIVTLCKAADLRSAMSLASAKIAQKFTLQNMLCDLESVYSTLINRQSSLLNEDLYATSAALKGKN